MYSECKCEKEFSVKNKFEDDETITVDVNYDCEETINKLEEIKKKSDIPKSKIIRIAIKEFYEKTMKGIK